MRNIKPSLYFVWNVQYAHNSHKLIGQISTKHSSSSAQIALVCIWYDMNTNQA